MGRLTEEQSKIVEENHSLIYWYSHLAGLNLADWYDLLAIELCYSVMKYDSTKGSLGNYFKLRADGRVYKEYRKSQSQKRKAEEVPYMENIHNVPYYDDTEGLMEVEDAVKREHGKILQLTYDGYTQTEVAKELGVSQSYVSKILKKMREEYSND